MRWELQTWDNPCFSLFSDRHFWPKLTKDRRPIGWELTVWLHPLYAQDTFWSLRNRKWMIFHNKTCFYTVSASMQFEIFPSGSMQFFTGTVTPLTLTVHNIPTTICNSTWYQVPSWPCIQVYVHHELCRRCWRQYMHEVVSCLWVLLYMCSRLGGMSRLTVQVAPPALWEGHPTSAIPVKYTCIQEGK